LLRFELVVFSFRDSWEEKPHATQAAAVGVTVTTVANIRRRYVEGGLDRPHRRRPPKLDGHQEAYWVALACSSPPEGSQRWTLRRLADRLVELGVVEAISHGTVGDILKNDARPWITQQWCIPRIDAEFVYRMEDILDLYERPLEAGEGKVCVDERPYRPGLPMKPKRPARQDSTYPRKGTCNLFVVLDPDRGWRDVERRRIGAGGPRSFPRPRGFTGCGTISIRTPWGPCTGSGRRKRPAGRPNGFVCIRLPPMPVG
jgi:transposase